jgi:hypothetical protein
MPNQSKPQLHELLSNLVDEKLGEQELNELQTLLRNDPDAQQFYVRYTMLHSWLTWDYVEQSPAESRLLSLQNQDAEQPEKTSPILGFLGDFMNYMNQHSPLSFVLLFVILGTALFAASVSLNNLSTSQPVAVADKPEIVAQITAMKDCQWSTAIDPPTGMMRLEVGRQLRLEKGLAQITYANGAVVLLEGPVSFTVDSPKSGFVSQGKLTARADTEKARRFTIVTPDARFVDLGTEFGVMIDDKGRAAVAVFNGKVNAEARLANGRWTAPVPLQKGESVVCMETKFTPQTIKRSDFPMLQSAPPPPSFQRWLDANQSIRRSRDCIAYYDFQPDPKNPKVLLNRAPSGAAYNGDILDAHWVDGRCPGKSALEFTSGNAGVRINLPGEYRQMTLIAWVESKTLANNYNGILMSDSWKKLHELHWGIWDSGSVEMCVYGQKHGGESNRTFSLDLLKDWCMIAGVINIPNQCSLYVNGELLEDVYSSEIPLITIGWATIGGWDNQGKGDSNIGQVHHFAGRIDELMIFQKAMTADEIKQIYESGKPY